MSPKEYNYDLTANLYHRNVLGLPFSRGVSQVEHYGMIHLLSLLDLFLDCTTPMVDQADPN
jgi:hypothetical protein